MKLKLKQQKQPFKIPENLKIIFKNYTLEMGVGVEVGELLPATHFWKVKDDGCSDLGYVWLNQQEQEGQFLYYLNLAVVEGQMHSGIGTYILTEIEDKLKTMGIIDVYAQVNCNRPDTGIIIRKMLLEHNWKLLRDNVSKRRIQLSDEDLIVADPCNLHFYKNII